MNKIFKSLSFAMIAATLITVIGCKKHTNDENLKIPPAQAHFRSKIAKQFYVTSVDDSFKIKIGITTVENFPRTVKLVTSSPTATEGVNYKLSTKTITIPAGKVIDSFYIKPISVSEYLSGRSDSVIISIVDDESSIKPSSYNGTFLVRLSPPCDNTTFSGADLPFMMGEYENTFDDPNTPSVWWSYLGSDPQYPYTAQVVSYTLTSNTTADMVVSNLSNYFGDLTFKVDWSVPTDITVIPITQNTDNAVEFATVSGVSQVGYYWAVRKSTGNNGTIDKCSNTMTLMFEVGRVEKATGNQYWNIFGGPVICNLALGED